MAFTEAYHHSSYWDSSGTTTTITGFFSKITSLFHETPDERNRWIAQEQKPIFQPFIPRRYKEQMMWYYFAEHL